MPTNMAAVQLVYSILTDEKNPITAQQVEWLREYALLYNQRFVAFTMLGLHAAASGLRDEGTISPDVIQNVELQWSHAVTENDASLELINRFASILYRDEAEPLGDRTTASLAILDLALHFRPSDARFLQSRGTIYKIEEDWVRAYDDLQTAYELQTSQRQLNPYILPLLIECAEQLDENEDLKTYRQKLKDYKEQLGRQQRQLSA